MESSCHGVMKDGYSNLAEEYNEPSSVDAIKKSVKETGMQRVLYVT